MEVGFWYPVVAAHVPLSSVPKVLDAIDMIFSIRKGLGMVDPVMFEITDIRLKPLSTKVRTLTYDNGKEFANHASIDQALGSISYFADPYSSWQRGSNENLNGLIRRYIPKSRPLSTVSDVELSKIDGFLNNRPRKRLGYKTPHEVFTKTFNPGVLHA